MRGVSDLVWREREEVLRRCSESGLCAAEFCRREGLAYWRFLAWRKRLAAPEPPAPFAELVVAQPPEVVSRGAGFAGALVEVALPSGAVVRVHAGAPAELVRTVVAAARGC